MSLLNELSNDQDLYARCPSPCCNKPFKLADAQLFDATQPLPSRAVEYLKTKRQDLRNSKLKFLKRKRNAKTRPAIGAQASNIGKSLEQIAPSLPGFPVHPSDCRALFEPIDYIIFHGLAAQRKIEAVTFVDVKSGGGTLTDSQEQIQAAVLAGNVTLTILTPSEDKKCRPS